MFDGEKGASQAPVGVVRILGLAASDVRLWVVLTSESGKLDGDPQIWGNDRYWYTKSFADPNRAPRYNFVVMKGMVS